MVELMFEKVKNDTLYGRWTLTWSGFVIVGKHNTHIHTDTKQYTPLQKNVLAISWLRQTYLTWFKRRNFRFYAVTSASIQ